MADIDQNNKQENNLLNKSYQEKTTQQMIQSQQNWQYTETITTINKSTPLIFKLLINDEYYISYKNDYKHRFYPKVIAFIIISIVIDYLLSTIPINQQLVNIIYLLQFSSVCIFTILSFLDPGTITTDQQEDFEHQRIYCLICGYYRLPTTKHCIFCNRCVKKFDHHCSFFGKCIGSRNLIFFWLFMMVASSTMIICFVSLIGALISRQIN